MPVNITLFGSNPYIILPGDVIGWLGWLILLALSGILLRKWWGIHQGWKRRHWLILSLLILITPLCSLFLVLRLPAGEALTPPSQIIDQAGPALVVFSALPWLLAAGLLGPAPAAGLGVFSGLMLAFWDTHSLYTPLELGLLGILASALIQQRYRTLAYRLWRHPFLAAVVVSALYPLLYLIDTLFYIGGTLANRIDYAITHLGTASLAIIAPLLLAGLFSELVMYLWPSRWGKTGLLIPSPSERRLEARFLYNMAPLAIILLLVLIIGDWFVADRAARTLLRDRMANTAQMASDTLPFFIGTGQNLIQKFALDPRLYNEPISQLSSVLEDDMHSLPYFTQLFYLDTQKNTLAGYPRGDYASTFPPPDELVGIDLALNKVLIQNYTVPPVEGEKAARVSFLATVLDENQEVRGVLIGRSNLLSNPYTQPVLEGMRNTVGTDGEGLLLDNNGRILYNTKSTRLMETYEGQIGQVTLFYDEAAPDGTRQLVFFQPMIGHPWNIVLSVPARRTQSIAINIAVPLLAMLVILFGVAVVLLRFGLRLVTVSLQSLSQEANRIASGQLDHPLSAGGEDEVGQLRRAFEKMRTSLKSRLDELNQLLVVSQGVASSLEVEEAIRPVLDSALAGGACSARVVLSPSAMPETGPDILPPARFGQGPATTQFSALDEQIMEMTRQQDRVILNNLARLRLLNMPTGPARPEALLAIALRHENTHYGALWLAYDRSHQFTEDEIRFLTTLAGQAALAAANNRLYQSAEIGRQRLAAILASSPDPVLVTDQQNRLLLANPAAWTMLGQGSNGYRPSEGQPVEQAIQQKELVKLLLASSPGKQSAEVNLSDGRIFLAMASPVSADGQRVGRVAVMRDITHFKELDSLKSEFVATVSHDLRSPLTLMRGYATMLEMVGHLNDQQNGYVRKIVSAVESMSRLVNNLLDLGRIEAGIDLQLEMVLVHDVVERVVSSMQLQATQKRIQLQADIPSQTVPLIEADQAMLQQALYNLVENAIKYTEAGGKVKVSLSMRENGLVFEVSDTGIGIAPVDQPRLFERFYRGAQRDQQKQHGSGLGLAIVKSIAERHGGRVWVESQLGKGSNFYLLIPLRQPERSQAAAKKKREA